MAEIPGCRTGLVFGFTLELRARVPSPREKEFLFVL